MSKGPSQRGARTLKTVPATDASIVNPVGTQAVKSPHRPVLVVISGEQMGERKAVEQSMLIGRDPSADLVLTDTLVSSRHALLEDRGDSWTLVDLGSTNGIEVNGRKGSELVLAPNDKLLFGQTVVRFEMQSPLEQAYDERVERLLTIDDLSGLFVRRKFDADLRAAIDTARADKTSLGLLVMDLDGVKAVNDTHGHLFGAYVIGEAGHVIGQVIAGRGFGSRFGGDEYLAALPGVDLAAALGVGEEIRRVVAEHHFERERIVLYPGISVGAAAFPESADEAASLFQCADEALYRAKRGGKNRVCQ